MSAKTIPNSEKPPSTISGIRNPKYTKWYNDSVSLAAHEDNQKVRTDECKCLSCGLVFKRDSALLEGFRFNRGACGYRGYCSACCGPIGDRPGSRVLISRQEYRLYVLTVINERFDYLFSDPIDDWEIPISLSFSGWMRNEAEAKLFKKQ